MKSLDTLNRRIVTTRQLRSIVGTMRSFSAISIHQYEEAAAVRAVCKAVGVEYAE